MKTSILVLAAHPDDEVLGCGGTIARFASEGCSVHVAFLADGVTARSDGSRGAKQPELAARRSAADKAGHILGVSSMSFGDLPDNRLDTIALLDIVKIIEELIETHRPTMVLTHHAADVNIDHRRIHDAVAVACRPQSGRSVKTVLSFEVPSSTEWQFPAVMPAFAPNWFFDISSFLDRKLQALEAYAVELREWPHPRSRSGVQHLARWRGACVGVDAAEAFILGRQLS